MTVPKSIEPEKQKETEDTSPCNHWLDQHLNETGRRQEEEGGFYVRMDDDAFIEHIPKGDAFEVRIERGDLHTREALQEYARRLTGYYQKNK